MNNIGLSFNFLRPRVFLRDPDLGRRSLQTASSAKEPKISKTYTTKETRTVNRKLESIAGRQYKGYETVSSTESKEYYLVPPPHKIAIPVCATSNDSYQVLACGLKDWSLPENVSSLPVCNVMVLKACMQDYLIVPVLKEKLVAKPVETLSPMEEDIIRQAKKNQSYISKRKSYITGDIDLG